MLLTTPGGEGLPLGEAVARYVRAQRFGSLVASCCTWQTRFGRLSRSVSRSGSGKIEKRGEKKKRGKIQLGMVTMLYPQFAQPTSPVRRTRTSW